MLIQRSFTTIFGRCTFVRQVKSLVNGSEDRGLQYLSALTFRWQFSKALVYFTTLTFYGKSLLRARCWQVLRMTCTCWSRRYSTLLYLKGIDTLRASMARLWCINSRKRGMVDWFKATNRDSAIANQTSSAWFITNNNTLRSNVNREREKHRRTWLFIWAGPTASGSPLPTSPSLPVEERLLHTRTFLNQEICLMLLIRSFI